MKQVEKPKVLSDEQFSEWCQAHQSSCKGECLKIESTRLCRQEAQRDADAAYYEPHIEFYKSAYEITMKAAKSLKERQDSRIQQAKAEVAREILNKMMCVRHEGHFGKPYDMYELTPSDYYAFESKYQEEK